jgi:hypothetical protein
MPQFPRLKKIFAPSGDFPPLFIVSQIKKKRDEISRFF